MREKSVKIQNWLTLLLVVAGTGLIATAYMDWYVPSPLLSFNLGLLSFGLFGIQLLRKDHNRKKEFMLLSAGLLYLNLLISGFVYRIWKYETIFTKQGITKMFIFVLLILSIYLIVAYIRAKITYKQVKGNQRHSEAWHVTKKELKKMEESDDIYIQLGIYEGSKQ